MYQYVNAFNVSVKNDKSEIIIDFFQNNPQFNLDETGNLVFSGVIREPVSSIILNNDTANEFLDSFTSLLNKEIE